MINTRKVVQEIFFQLDFDADGAYIRVMNSKGEEVHPAHEYYTGATREVLKAIEAIHDHNSFVIDWNKPEKKIYLSTGDFLFWHLRHCDNFVDNQGNPIHFSAQDGRIRMLVEETQKGILNAQIVLSHEGNRISPLAVLNETHVLAQGSIYSIQPLGENFRMIESFQTALLPADLPAFLAGSLCNRQSLYAALSVRACQIPPRGGWVFPCSAAPAAYL